MTRSRAFVGAVVIAAGLCLALPGCSGVKGGRSVPPGEPTDLSQAGAQVEQQGDEVDRLLQELDSSLRSTDTLLDVPELNR